MLPFRVVSPTRPTLHEVGVAAGTDKVMGGHIWFKKSYMDRYATYFNELRDMPIKFLEIGVLNGASLRAWRAFFPRGEIHGIDVRPECKQYEDPKNGIFVHIVDCSVVEELEAFKAKFPNYFDVILDDGSHINDITLKTFKSFYDCVKSVGYYIVEDLGCAYNKEELPEHTKFWPGISVTKEVPDSNDPETILDLYKEIHAMIDIPSNLNKYQFEYLHHYTYIVVLRKNEQYLRDTTIYSRGSAYAHHVHTTLRTDA